MRTYWERCYENHPNDDRRIIAISHLNTVTVVAITTTIRHVPSELYLTPEDGMPTERVVNFYNINTVPQSRVGALVAILPPEQLTAVD